MKKSSILFLLIVFYVNASFAQSVGTTEGVFNVSDLGAKRAGLHDAAKKDNNNPDQ